jgi:hypothetical protein
MARKRVEATTASNRFEVDVHIIANAARLVQVHPDDEFWEGVGDLSRVKGAFVMLEPGADVSDERLESVREMLTKAGAIFVHSRARPRSKLVPESKVTDLVKKTLREYAAELLADTNSKDRDALGKVVDATMSKRGM